MSPGSDSINPGVVSAVYVDCICVAPSPLGGFCKAVRTTFRALATRPLLARSGTQRENATAPPDTAPAFPEPESVGVSLRRCVGC